jgi:creatinine amidohydrolase
MQLSLCTWQDVEQYLRHDQRILIPIGSTEQHGPTGLIGTDAICPELIAREFGQQHGIMVAPTLSIGMAQHHMAFPGSISLRPSTLINVIHDVVTSLTQHGFRKILFLNGHGGNINTIRSAFAEVLAGYGPDQSAPAPELGLHNWYLGKQVRELAKKLYGDAEGAHATPTELSLSWVAYPDSARHQELTPRIAPSGHSNLDAAAFRRQFPDGRMASDPSLASVADGKKILAAAVADLQRILES